MNINIHFFRNCEIVIIIHLVIEDAIKELLRKTEVRAMVGYMMNSCCSTAILKARRGVGYASSLANPMNQQPVTIYYILLVFY